MPLDETSPPPNPKVDRWTGQGGVHVARGVSSWSCFRCLRFRSLGGFRSRLQLRLLRRVSAACRSVGGPVRARGAQRASSAVWRWRWRCWRVAGGSLLPFSRLGLAAGAGSVWVLPHFFRGRCEPRTPGVGPVGLPVGGWGFCVEIALLKKAMDFFVCMGVSSSAQASTFVQPRGRSAPR